MMRRSVGMFHYSADMEHVVFYRQAAMRCHAKDSDKLKRVNIRAAKHWLDTAMLTRLNTKPRGI